MRRRRRASRCRRFTLLRLILSLCLMHLPLGMKDLPRVSMRRSKTGEIMCSLPRPLPGLDEQPENIAPASLPRRDLAFYPAAALPCASDTTGVPRRHPQGKHRAVRLGLPFPCSLLSLPASFLFLHRLCTP